MYIHLLFTVYLGFNWEQIDKIGFLSKKIDPNKKNIIFIHGLGFGYVPYFQMLMELSKKYNLFIIVLPDISSYNYYDDLNSGLFPENKIIVDSFYNWAEQHKIINLNITKY
jgi:hypothetical protein